MKTIMQALNKPEDAFKIKNKWVAWGLVVFTILVNTVFEPLLQFASDTGNYTFDWQRTALAALLGAVTYLAVCALIWLVCKGFGSKTTFGDYAKSWGLTYFPTLLCAIVVAFTEAYFYFFWNSMIWGMVFNILFLGILLWKTVLYVLYLREVAKLKGGRMIGAFIVIGIFIILLAMANGYFGIKTPVL
jgi:hypothetical protein